MVSEVVGLLADTPLPLEIGHFELDERGALSCRDARQPMHFAFEYAGFPFACTVSRADQARIDVCATLGALPYTAESPYARAFLMRLLETTGQFPSGRFMLTEHGELRLLASKPSLEPCTAVRVMAVVAAVLLEFKPYAEALRHLVNPSPATA